MKAFGLLILFFAASSGFAGDKDPRPDMQIILQDIRALEKYLLSDAEFIKPENDKEIKGSLEKLNAHLNDLKNREVFRDDPALRTNLDMITDHMQRTERYFKENSKQFARYMLRSSLQMCIGCHTRGKSGVELSFDSNLEDNSSADYGDFLLATRQFTKAQNFFEKKLVEYKKGTVSVSDLQRSLLNLAVLYTRVKPDPARAISTFQAFVKRTDIPEYLKRDVSGWIEDFRSWQKSPTEMKERASELELLAAAKRLLKNDDLTIADFEQKMNVRRLRASILLHRLLESPGKSPIKGEGLYLLGLLYNRLQHQMFFRFDDMYFRTCIREYPKTKTSRDCYNALERSILNGYTGSAGTNIPNEEEVELIRLKRLAY